MGGSWFSEVSSAYSTATGLWTRHALHNVWMHYAAGLRGNPATTCTSLEVHVHTQWALCTLGIYFTRQWCPHICTCSLQVSCKAPLIQTTLSSNTHYTGQYRLYWGSTLHEILVHSTVAKLLVEKEMRGGQSQHTTAKQHMYRVHLEGGAGGHLPPWSKCCPPLGLS